MTLHQISDGIEEAIRRVEAAQRALPALVPSRLTPSTPQYHLTRAWVELNELRIAVNDAAESESESPGSVGERIDWLTSQLSDARAGRA